MPRMKRKKITVTFPVDDYIIRGFDKMCRSQKVNWSDKLTSYMKQELERWWDSHAVRS